MDDNAVIEIHGKVDLPVNGDNPNNMFTWVLDAKNVTITGVSGDNGEAPTLYCSTPLLNGPHDGQQTMLVEGDGVTIKDLTILPNYYSNMADTDETGKTNKTIEITAQNFTMQNVTIQPNELVLSEDKTSVSTEDGGALYFTGSGLQERGGLKNILVEGCSLDKTHLTFDSATPTDNIQILNNTFIGTKDVDEANADFTEDFYFVSNTTWATPVVKEMGNVLLQGNSFTEMPEGFNKVVLQRMAGAFILRDNKTDDTTKIIDRVSFAKYDRAELSGNLENGQAKIIVDEGGKTYQLTVENEESLKVISKDVTADQAPVALVVTPSMDVAGAVSVNAGTTVLSVAEPTSEDFQGLPIVKAVIGEKLAATDYKVNTLGQLCVKPEAFVEAATASLSQDKVPAAANIAPLPVVSADVEANETAAMAFVLDGKDLKASQASAVKVLKILSADTAMFMNYASADAAVQDGSFKILDMQGETASALNSHASYQLVLFVKDNGSFDVDPEGGSIVDPAAIVGTPTQQSYYDGGGSSGCNAGFAALALLLAAPLVSMRKHF